MQFKRYPSSKNKSLHAFSAADEHLLRELDSLSGPPLIAQDRFGYLTCQLHAQQPSVLVNYHSQQKAIEQNLQLNQLDKKAVQFFEPLKEIKTQHELALLRVPKSLDLFEWYVQQLAAALIEEGRLLAGFMTRHFSPQLLEIANKYFEEVEQSRAWKKSRVLKLSKKKKVEAIPLLHQLEFKGQQFEQYYGVFSAKHIDYASQFLVENLKVDDGIERVLDLAAGNGVLGYFVRQQAPQAELHLLDDSYLAIASARRNLSKTNTQFHVNDTLAHFPKDYFDLVVSNPPFHFEYENNIEVSLQLFKAVHRCLRPGGRFQLVANKHLNYQTHLKQIFSTVEVVAEDKKYVVYSAR